MHETAHNGSGLPLSLRAAMRGFRLAAVLLGICVVFSAGTVRAQDEQDEEINNKSFERRLIDNLMSGLGAKRLGDGEINYRERSPLVLPSKIDLPPPESRKPKLAPNWPKDPDEAERKAAREAANQKAVTVEESRRTLLPSELAQRAPRGASKKEDTTTPGANTSAPLSMLPSQLGYNGGLFNSLWGGSAKPEAEKFTGEPDRDELTQPPVGYQTPSPGFAYGTGPAEAPKVTCDPKSGVCEGRFQQ